MIKIMSFNIRYGLARDGVNHWQYRKALALARIKTFQPDLLGLQECLDPYQADFVRDNLKDYLFYGVHRSDSDVEMAPALLRKKKFTLLDQGCFWLSESPQVVGSKNWDAAFPRTCTWFKLLEKATGKELIFLNTHFDYQPVAIKESAQVLQQWVMENVGQLPLIITGDFNAEKNSHAYQLLTRQLFDTHPNCQTTFHDFGKLKSAWSIDWILASEHFSVLDSSIDNYHKNALYPSDHYPLTATLKWKI